MSIASSRRNHRGKKAWQYGGWKKPQGRTIETQAELMYNIKK